uniref:Uncharacterized protein n=1 Tax=viral metagenome TaxID=1070528 RepID=A0A6C0CBA8_9ZZZZ
MENLQFQFHDPTNIIDFYFIALQYAKDTSIFYSKFLTTLPFKIYSIANVNDIIIIILNSDGELEKVKTTLEKQFGEINSTSVSGNAFSLVMCVDDIMFAKKNNVFKTYDLTLAEETDRQKYSNVDIERYHKRQNSTNEQKSIDYEKLQQEHDATKIKDLAKWKERETKIKEQTYKTYIPRQNFINIFNKTDESHVIFMLNYVLNQILHSCQDAVTLGRCDLLKWRVELIECVWSYADELQYDSLVNRFYNFKSPSNINIINHLRKIYEKNKNICLCRWGMIRQYYEANKNVPADYPIILGNFVTNEFITFMETGFFSREKFVYEVFEKKPIPKRPVFHWIFPDQFNTFSDINGVSNIITSFLRKKKNIKRLVERYECSLLLYMAKIDIHSTIINIPKDILYHIVYFMMAI